MEVRKKLDITVGLIVKNEEERIEFLLTNITNYVKEVIVVDNGSSDRTLELAYMYANKVFVYPNATEAELRNVYIENSSCPWIMSLDADEEVETCFWSKLEKKLAVVDQDVVSFIVPIYSYYGNGKWSHFTTHRIFRNNSLLRYYGEIHPSITKKIYSNNLKFELFEEPIHHMDALIKKRCKSKRQVYENKILLELEKCTNKQHRYRLLCYLAVEYIARKEYVKAITILNYLVESKDLFTNIAKLYLIQVYIEMMEISKAEEIIECVCDKYSVASIENDPNSIIKLFRDNSTFSDEFLQRLFISIAQINIYKGNKQAALIFAKAGLILYPFASQHYLNVASLIEDEKQKEKYLLEAIKLNSYIINKVIYVDGELENIYRFQTSLLSTVVDLELNSIR